MTLWFTTLHKCKPLQSRGWALRLTALASRSVLVALLQYVSSAANGTTSGLHAKLFRDSNSCLTWLLPTLLAG